MAVCTLPSSCIQSSTLAWQDVSSALLLEDNFTQHAHFLTHHTFFVFQNYLGEGILGCGAIFIADIQTDVWHWNWWQKEDALLQ